jgi:hypothetical protein
MGITRRMVIRGRGSSGLGRGVVLEDGRHGGKVGIVEKIEWR